MPSRPSRRPVRAAWPAAVLLLGPLAACGDDSDASAPTATSSAAAADAFPVAVEHRFGTTTIEEQPQRVVTVGFNEQDFTLALGVTPVGVREYLGYDFEARPWAQDLLPDESLPTVGDEEIDFEAVAALEPDLILGVYAFLEESDYELLSGIAPTVAESADFAVGGTPWQEQTRMTGAALGVPDEAEALVADVEAEFAAAREVNPEFAGAVLPLDYVFEGEHFVLEEQDLRNRFFTDLGFATPETQGAISGELLDALDEDVLVVVGQQPEELLTNDLFAALDVVREDRTVFLGDFTQDFSAALGFGSPLSLSFALEEAVPRLADAVDGDPATAVEPYTG